MNGTVKNLWHVNSADNRLGSRWQFVELDVGSMLGTTNGFTVTIGAMPPKSRLSFSHTHVDISPYCFFTRLK